MTAWSIALRLLLSLGLVLNGGGWAMASAHMPVSRATVDAERPVPATSMQMRQASCHEHAAVAHAAPETHHHAPAQPASGCCKSGTCDCACASAQATLAVVLVPLAVPGNAPGIGRLALGHAAPALPHLIRPPIG